MILSSTGRLLATLLLSLTALTAAHAAEPDLRTELKMCADPEAPREVSKYGLAGQVQLGFDLSPAGVVDNVTVLKSSGWNELDASLIAALAKCQFSADLAASKQKFQVKYIYKPGLRNPGVRPPTIRQETCPASDIFGDFIMSRDEAIYTTLGIAMRFDIDEVGRVSGLAFEDRDWDPRMLGAARAYIEACRFNPTNRMGAKFKGAASGRLTFKAQVVAK